MNSLIIPSVPTIDALMSKGWVPQQGDFYLGNHPQGCVFPFPSSASPAGHQLTAGPCAHPLPPRASHPQHPPAPFAHHLSRMWGQDQAGGLLSVGFPWGSPPLTPAALRTGTSPSSTRAPRPLCGAPDCSIPLNSEGPLSHPGLQEVR